MLITSSLKFPNYKRIVLDSHYLSYSGGTLACESVPLDELAEQYGTPLFVVSRQSLISQYRTFEEAFAALPHFTCYSVKANFNLAVIRTLADEGCGCDVNSGGELYRALKAGVPADRIIMAGVGKTEPEIEYGLTSGVKMIKAESISELKAIDRVAGRLGKVAQVGIRVTPNVIAETHPYITTGDSKEKFGLDEAGLQKVFDLFKTLPNLELHGLDMHIGSQIFDPEYYVAATQKLLEVLESARQLGFDIKWLDLGGGFPATYDPQKPATPITRFAEKLIPMLEGKGVTVIFEPGRFIAANSAILVTKILYRKKNHTGKEFFIVDAGMTELIRPALYQSHHEVLAVTRHGKTVVADMVGPVCESSDFFARHRTIDDAPEGELLAVLSAGAYGAVMSSNYNGRLRSAEVMVDNGTVTLIRRRETYEQLVQNEI